MLDVKLLRENLAEVKKRLADRQLDISFDAWAESDQRQRALKAQIEGLKAKKNQASEEIARSKREKSRSIRSCKR
ncbi:MAG: hypothetical protein MPW14_14615 [Candidatus Manganitrophus sp.]|nr:MAG: hypothetical protein MPW14_14615 [Candidatus Manganitrophus sp.]